MKYPDYVENFLPLSNFEEMVEEARKEHFKDTDPFDDPEEANQSDVDFFNENFIGKVKLQNLKVSTMF